MIARGVDPLDVSAAPRAHAFDERQKRPAVFAQRIFDRRGGGASRLTMHDLVVDQLAQLLSENFLCNAGHEFSQRREVLRRLCQPVHDDQLPLAADGGQGRSQWTSADRIRPPLAPTVT